MTALRTLALIFAFIGSMSLAGPAAAQPVPGPVASAPPAQWRAEDVATLARMIHPEGIPVDVVATIPRAVAQPVLLRMLDDPRQQRAWPNVVGMLGIVGDAAAGRALMAFIARAEIGPLSGDQARAKSGAVVGLGYLVQRTGDAAALDFLIGGVRPSAWGGDILKWTAASTPDQLQRARLFATLSIMGLGVSGDARALGVVQAIANGTPPFADVRTQVPGAQITASEAVQNNQVVRAGDLRVLYKVQANPNVPVLRPGSVSVRETSGILRDRRGESVTIVPVPSSPAQTVVPPSDGRGSCPPSGEGFCGTIPAG